MSKRAHLNLTTKLASALLALGEISYEDAKAMGEKNFLSLWHFDHGVLVGVNPIDDFWNLTPRLIVPHRRKSAVDTTIIAKVKRNEEKHADFCRRVLPKAPGSVRRPSRWPKRKMRRANTSLGNKP